MDGFGGMFEPRLPLVVAQGKSEGVNAMAPTSSKSLVHLLPLVNELKTEYDEGSFEVSNPERINLSIILDFEKCLSVMKEEGLSLFIAISSSEL